MSIGIRIDSLLVHYLADELRERLHYERIRAVRIDADERRAALELDTGALVFELHPTRGFIVEAATPAAPRVLPLHRSSQVRAVETPPDERLLSIRMSHPGTGQRPVQRVVVELMTNQRNLLALDRDARIVAALWPRDAGSRRLRPGERYEPPGAPPRTGADAPIEYDEWHALLADVAPQDRAGALIRNVAYTSSVNAAAVLGSAARERGDALLRDAYERYHEIADLPPVAPVVLKPDGGGQPYPMPLPGISSTPADTLLDAMGAAAGIDTTDAAPRPEVPPELIERLRDHIERDDRRIRRLNEELEGARPEAAELRRAGNLLLSQLHEVEKGMTAVTLSDLEGGSVTLELDPKLAPNENATAYYDRARKRESAADRIPKIVRQTAARRDRRHELLERVEAGDADADEVEEAVGPRPETATTDAPTGPYRRYRTSGGLEVRVGRSRKANDELTFHQSSPDDVWMHARDVGGAHVILRWPNSDANPPRRDLLEAAVLAALNSKARTSGTVAVDWTRRKYVRKPRKSPPGLVVPDRVKTVFVEPSPGLEKKLRAR